MKVADAGDRGRFSWRVARRHDVVVLRDFELGDQPEVPRLILSGMRERWRERYDDAANPDVDDMSSYLANGGEVVVWEEHGAVVGTGTLASFASRGEPRSISAHFDIGSARSGNSDGDQAAVGPSPMRVGSSSPNSRRSRAFSARSCASSTCSAVASAIAASASTALRAAVIAAQRSRRPGDLPSLHGGRVEVPRRSMSGREAVRRVTGSEGK
jgi:hypothetical protein